MASQSTGRSRRPRGGSRRRGGNDRPYRQNSPAKAPAKQTFWQKITAFFSPNGNPPSTPVSRSNDDRPRNNNNNGAPRSAEQPARSSRKPESVAVTTPRLYVGNLSFEATESDLFELFNGVGAVQNAEVVTYKHNQRSKGFAFVQMQTVEEAQRAVAELHDKDFLGRKLVVSGAKSTEHQSDSH
jgi:RNA recognition motif-containing protein